MNNTKKSSASTTSSKAEARDGGEKGGNGDTPSNNGGGKGPSSKAEARDGGGKGGNNDPPSSNSSGKGGNNDPPSSNSSGKGPSSKAAARTGGGKGGNGDPPSNNGSGNGTSGKAEASTGGGKGGNNDPPSNNGSGNGTSGKAEARTGGEKGGNNDPPSNSGSEDDSGDTARANNKDTLTNNHSGLWYSAESPAGNGQNSMNKPDHICETDEIRIFFRDPFEELHAEKGDKATDDDMDNASAARDVSSHLQKMISLPEFEVVGSDTLADVTFVCEECGQYSAHPRLESTKTGSRVWDDIYYRTKEAGSVKMAAGSAATSFYGKLLRDKKKVLRVLRREEHCAEPGRLGLTARN